MWNDIKRIVLLLVVAVCGCFEMNDFNDYHHHRFQFNSMILKIFVVLGLNGWNISNRTIWLVYRVSTAELISLKRLMWPMLLFAEVKMCPTEEVSWGKRRERVSVHRAIIWPHKICQWCPFCLVCSSFYF